jgi:hypothetical protein
MNYDAPPNDQQEVIALTLSNSWRGILCHVKLTLDPFQRLLQLRSTDPGIGDMRPYPHPRPDSRARSMA